MDEPYEIGVRLALDDGVSVGMAALRGELASLQRVIGAGLPSLGRPGATTPGAAPAARLLRTAQVGAAQAPVVPLPERRPPPALPGMPMPTPTTPPPPAAIPVAASSAPVPTTEQPPAPAAPTIALPSPTSPPPPPIAPAAPTSQPAPAASRDTATLLAPVVLPLLHRDTRVAPPPPAMPTTAAPIAAPQFAAPLPASAATTPAAALPSMAPQRPPPQDSAGGGDVYLDGQLLGCWMENRLTRAAGRPQGGSAAFDGRMAPAWPGALQGS
jgi:hypothetical protein